MAILEYIAAILFFIFIHNWIRNRDEIIPNWPILGMLPAILHHVSNLHDYATLVLKHHGGTLRFEGPWFTNMNFILTSNPMNVHHITSKNFENYGKGSNFLEIFDVLGDGIFISDSHEWKQQRTILHSLLKRKSFEMFLQQSIQKKLENCLIPFLDHASKTQAHDQVVDLQDILRRFTFDSTCSFILGFDPNCLPNKFTTELSEFTYEKAIPVLEDVVFYRHITPRCFWKLLKWLQISHEKKFKIAQENLDQFLIERITSAREERNRTNESHLDLLKVLLKEGYGKVEMNDKYLRDTAMDLLVAGNGTISAGLIWFFWLVSTHPGGGRSFSNPKAFCCSWHETWLEGQSYQEMHLIEEAMPCTF
ncbi:Cytochrome P450 [Sesbania bispinosa]|nr:Cytochrome P450 [Sesbania bispinosa]